MLASCIILVQACYKDKGNYDIIDYNRINSITLPLPPPIVMGNTIRITPAIEWKYPERDTLSFDYEWRQGDSVISNEKHLEFIPNATGNILIYLYAKEKSTGIVSRSVTQIQVISAYKAGWLLLTNNNGRSGLTYIRRDAHLDINNMLVYEYKQFTDIYDDIFPGNPLGENPIKLITKVFPDFSRDEVLVLQDNSPVFLNGDNFSKTTSLLNEFPEQAIPNNVTAIDYADGNATNFVLSADGKLYWKRNNKPIGGLHEGLYMDVPIYFEGGDSEIKSILNISTDHSSFVYVYDDLNKRFLGLYTTMGITDFLGSKMYTVNTATPPSGWVDLSNMNGYSLMYCGDYANASSFVNIIKDNATGQFLYQTYILQMNYTSLGVSDQQQEVFAGNGIVSDNTVYYRIPNSSYLFFGEGSKLYFYDVNTKNVKLYSDFGAGRIKKIISDADSGEIGVALDNGIFYICSVQNTILGSNDPGDAGILFQSENIGNIIDLNWKWGSFMDYMMRKYPS